MRVKRPMEPRCNEGVILAGRSTLEFRRSTWIREFQRSRNVWVPGDWQPSGVVQKRVGIGLGSWVVVFWLEVSAWGWLRWCFSLCFSCSIIFNLINNFQDGWQPQQQQPQNQPNITITRAKVKSRTSSSFESGLLWLSVWRLVLRTNDEISHGERHSIAKGMPNEYSIIFYHNHIHKSYWKLLQNCNSRWNIRLKFLQFFHLRYYPPQLDIFCQRCCRGQVPLSEAPPVGPLRCVSWRENAICHGIKGGPGDQLPEKNIDEVLYV